MSNGLDAMKQQKEARRRPAPESAPPQVEPAKAPPPTLTAVPAPAAAQPAPKKQSAPAAAAQPAAVAAADAAGEREAASAPPAGRAARSAVPVQTIDPAEENRILKAVTDAGGAWAASARKLLERQDSFLQTLTAAKAAGLPILRLQAEVQMVEAKANGITFDPDEIKQALGLP